MEKLFLVFGDQLDVGHPLFEEVDSASDAVWMAEVKYESEYAWSHKQRTAFFFSAMRHFRDLLQEKEIPVYYHMISETVVAKQHKFSEVLGDFIKKHSPKEVVVVKPGEYRVEQGVRQVCDRAGVSLRMLEDKHFYSSPEHFAEHAKGRNSLRMEYFYREMRKEHGILMEDKKKPIGDAWNFDKENRGSFGKQGPQDVPPPLRIKPDRLTQSAMRDVEEYFSDNPGELEHFAWAVTREEALQVLEDFVLHRLPQFGEFQDAMWTDQPFLYHSLISSCLNIKLLNPREVVEAVEKAYHDGHASIAACEGFIRQVIGWREYVHGVYWMFMPDYLDRNELEATEKLPDFYWTGEADMTCLSQSIGQVIDYAYGHHIQRLMVTGLFAMLYGVDPKAIHAWYLAMYVDAIEWVELPNTLGMSQFADGSVMGSKPYAATGKYIDRMSNYCKECRFDPSKRVGEEACPFTTLYWDFLIKHREKLSSNHRMGFQLKNVDKLSDEVKAQIIEQAGLVRARYA